MSGNASSRQQTDIDQGPSKISLTLRQEMKWRTTSMSEICRDKEVALFPLLLIGTMPQLHPSKYDKKTGWVTTASLQKT